MKALDKLHDISRTLKHHKIDSHDKEAEIILQTALNINVIDIYRDDPELTEKQMSLLESVVSRRTSREPLQYILGYVEFMGLRIQVGKGVLIPRPETELMAEIAIKAVSDQRSAVSFQKKSEIINSKLQTLNLKPNSLPITHHPSPITILDLCTGSGCLALALAKEFPDAQVYGVDISDDALSYAKRNAGLNEINNVSFIRGKLLSPFKNPPKSPFSKGGLIFPSLAKRGKGRLLELIFFDLIISNPPYIKSDDIKNLQTEIKDWEPLSALDGGANGLDYYKMIIPSARQFLKPKGMLILELGIDCADAVTAMLKNAGYTAIELIKDYAGVERIAVGA
jgi:release factor glutamine methyltransferase